MSRCYLRLFTSKQTGKTFNGNSISTCRSRRFESEIKQQRFNWKQIRDRILVRRELWNGREIRIQTGKTIRNIHDPISLHLRKCQKAIKWILAQMLSKIACRYMWLMESYLNSKEQSGKYYHLLICDLSAEFLLYSKDREGTLFITL